MKKLLACAMMFALLGLTTGCPSKTTTKPPVKKTKPPETETEKKVKKEKEAETEPEKKPKKEKEAETAPKTETAPKGKKKDGETAS